jgi:Tfp pilus assembly protein PilO
MILLAVLVGVWYVYVMISEKKKNAELDKVEAGEDTLVDNKEDYNISTARGKLNKRTRNLIILIVILLLISGGTYWNYTRLADKQKKLMQEKTNVSNELNTSNNQLMRIDQVNEQLEKMREEVFLNNKIMMKNDTPTQTLRYLFDIANKYAKFFHFDYGLSESGMQTEDPNVFYNQYVITGKAFMNQIFAFLDQIERQSAFYTIESIALNTLDINEKGKVQFSIELRAYFTATGEEMTDIGFRGNKLRRLAYNPFYPRIHDPIKNNDREFLSLVDIEAVDMVALSTERVFVKSQNNGIIKILNIGDRVRYGYLESIDWNKQVAIFSLNRYGVTERIRLSIK